MVTYESDLIAGGGNGGGTKIGRTVLNYDAASKTLKVSYLLDDANQSNRANGWRIDGFHFDFGANEGDIPTTRSGNPQIGLFDYSDSNTSFNYEPYDRGISFTISNVEEGELVYWAAHADVSSPEATSEFNQAFASPAVDGTLSFRPGGNQSYFSTTVMDSSIPWLNGTFDGWCVDTDNVISYTSYTPTGIYSSLNEDALEGKNLVDKWQNLGAVNWLINNFKAGDTVEDLYSFAGADASFGDYKNGGPLADDGGLDALTGQRESWTITSNDIQNAIWRLIEDGGATGPSPNLSAVDELADRAYHFGKTYVPPCDGEVAVILGISGRQTTIIELPYQVLGSCTSLDETAWGVMDDGDTFGGKSWADRNKFASTMLMA